MTPEEVTMETERVHTSRIMTGVMTKTRTVEAITADATPVTFRAILMKIITQAEATRAVIRVQASMMRTTMSTIRTMKMIMAMMTA